MLMPTNPLVIIDHTNLETLAAGTTFTIVSQITAKTSRVGHYFIDGPHTVETLHCTRRNAALLAADRVSVIPVLGNLVGGARLLGSAGAMFIAGLGWLIGLAFSQALKDKSTSLMSRSCDEFNRGFLEAFGVSWFGYLDNLCKRQDMDGFLTNTPHGEYVYENQAHTMHFYSKDSRTDKTYICRSDGYRHNAISFSLMEQAFREDLIAASKPAKSEDLGGSL